MPKKASRYGLRVPWPGAHRIQEVVLRRNVLCVLDRAFRVVEGRFRLKGTQSERL